MFRSSTTYARRFLCLAAAALGVLAATGCSNTTGSGRRAADPTDLDNPVHTRFESMHVAESFPVTSSAFGAETHSGPNRWAHVSALPR